MKFLKHPPPTQPSPAQNYSIVKSTALETTQQQITRARGERDLEREREGGTPAWRINLRNPHHTPKPETNPTNSRHRQLQSLSLSSRSI